MLYQPSPSTFQASSTAAMISEPAPLPQPNEFAFAQPTPDEMARQAAKIMLVDDEELGIEMLQAFLEDVGYKNFLSTSVPSEALETMRNERPDVLLLDLVMPGISGFEILKQMQTDKVLRRVPVIMLTAAADAATKLEALNLGATDFLSKPVDSSELVLRLRNTLAAKAYQDQLAYSDVLTGLANRERFLDRLDWTVRFSRRYDTTGAVLQIGLDRFKQINEALGPGIGDRLLRAVAQRLEESLRDTDIIARITYEDQYPLLSRMGGDEFTLLLPVLEKSADAGTVAQRILDGIAVPFNIGGHELFVTCCVGVALFPTDGTARDTVLKAAGVAMRHAKRDGRDTRRFFSKELNTVALDRLSLENELRGAVERNELELHYQPKVDLQTNTIVGAEALARWNHPQRGMVYPADFVPLAEETGLIVSLGQWALNTTCQQIGEWLAAGLNPPRISVNVSSHQFRQRSFVGNLKGALSSAQIDPKYLCLEVTESAVMGHAQDNIRALNEIKASGVTLSIDDFGTGYSSLSYLTRLPLDEIKIDRSFVCGINREKDNTAIATAIVAMAHSLGLRVVAEGVEHLAELGVLMQLGCDEAQGYLFSTSLPAGEFGALLLADGLPELEPPPSLAG